jgi:hypothetical protein
MKKYKFITIRQDCNEVFNNKPVYRIYANRGGSQLGIISWYKPWKEYVFSSRDECVFNNGCLKDVLDFIDIVIPTLNKITNAQVSDTTKAD